VHPLGKSPVIVDDTITVAEIGGHHRVPDRSPTAADIDPSCGQRRALRYTLLLHYAEGSAMPPLLLKLCSIGWRRVPPLAHQRRCEAHRRYGAEFLHRAAVKRHSGLYGGALGAHPWFAGEEFSAADVK